MITQLLPVSEQYLAMASALLRQGELVAFPTETVYGLGADALNAEAVRAISKKAGLLVTVDCGITGADEVRLAKALGMPDGNDEKADTTSASPTTASKRLYRDPDDKRIAGVCSGLALNLDVDVTLVRVLMLAALIFGSAGFWIYIILWIVVPLADTPAKKCELRGIPPTPENMSRFTTYTR